MSTLLALPADLLECIWRPGDPEPLPCDRDVVSDEEFHAEGLCLDGRSDGCRCRCVRCSGPLDSPRWPAEGGGALCQMCWEADCDAAWWAALAWFPE